MPPTWIWTHVAWITAIRVSHWAIDFFQFNEKKQCITRGILQPGTAFLLAGLSDLWVVKVLSALKSQNKLSGVWVLFKTQKSRTAVSRYQSSSTRLMVRLNSTFSMGKVLSSGWSVQCVLHQRCYKLQSNLHSIVHQMCTSPGPAPVGSY